MHAGRAPMPLGPVLSLEPTALEERRRKAREAYARRRDEAKMRAEEREAGPPALISVPVRPDPPAPLRATIVAPPVKRPAPSAPSAPKTLGPTDADLRAALLALGQPCAPQQEASVTLAAKKRPRECPLNEIPSEDERVAVWNRVTGNSEDLEIVSLHRVISEGLERTTREVILEDRGPWRATSNL